MEEVEQNQELEDRLDDSETVGKARRIYLEIADLEKEESEHKERAKDARKRIDGRLGLIRSLICDPKQLELPSAPVASENAEPPCTSASGHKWERFREGEMILEDCANCPMERTAQVIRLQDNPDDPEVIEHGEWIYTKSEGAGSEAVEEPVTP